ncbi:MULTISPECIES: lysine N(6)-hydroxylase/L-ornithine N(5)-oxygenase family protein [Rhodomicrobium]|uniref:lysine N(6)-hydroxylase/L-ornithine N(5)-oxygenase family protein n=1 Tax=Rhodomicrobium TaxID=1068 RepID=UPI000B4AC213|nr:MULTISPECIES: lysine N(6)-hydroxylase/L-ornithine N(5)-oxygenase family protein [Rhodomicrobium]
MQPSTVFHDLIGVGFGPSNLALAIALEEAGRQGRPLSARFLEKQERFVWHGGMLLPGSNMQISFLKDLVLLRDPTSPFTFVNYLHAKGRLEAFINLKRFFPSRIEFNDYLCWVAARFAEKVAYGEEVVGIEPESARGPVTHLAVQSRNAAGQLQTRLTRNLVLAVGGQPKIPAIFERLRDDRRMCHSAAYLARLPALGIQDHPATRIAVVGRGQSAAEIALDLHERFGTISIDMIARGTTLKPADGTPFVNEIFNPDYTDFIFNQPPAVREGILAEFRNTNYAVVDADLIERLYQIVYGQKVSGAERFALLSMHDIKEAAAGSGRIELAMLDGVTGEAKRAAYDAVILATGYDRDGGAKLLSGLGDYIPDLTVTRNYRVQTTPDFSPAIYMQGYSEATHGLSDTLLSVLAIRSQEIAKEICAATNKRQTAA